MSELLGIVIVICVTLTIGPPITEHLQRSLERRRQKWEE